MTGMARGPTMPEQRLSMSSTPNRGYNPSVFWGYIDRAKQAVAELNALGKGSREVGLAAVANYIGRVNLYGSQSEVEGSVMGEVLRAGMLELDFKNGSRVQKLVSNAFSGFIGAANELFNSGDNGGSPSDWTTDLDNLRERQRAIGIVCSTLKDYPVVPVVRQRDKINPDDKIPRERVRDNIMAFRTAFHLQEQ